MNSIFQFAFELLGLYLLFIIFRAVVVKTFGVKVIGTRISEESLRALKRYKHRFTFIFMVLSILLTISFWFLFKQLLQYLRSGTEGIILTIENFALMLPALLLALLVANTLGRWINAKLQRDGLGFFFEGYEEELEGFDRNRIKKWQIGLTLVLVSAILVGEYNYYVLATADEIKYKTGVFEQEQHLSYDEVQTLITEEEIFLILHADTLNMNAFSGNKIDFLARLK